MMDLNKLKERVAIATDEVRASQNSPDFEGKIQELAKLTRQLKDEQERQKSAIWEAARSGGSVGDGGLFGGSVSYGAPVARAYNSKPKGWHKRLGEQLKNLAEKRAQNESVSSEGGFLVDPEVSEEIVRDVVATSNLLSRLRTIQLRTNRIKIKAHDNFDHSSGSVFAGVQSSFTSEGTEFTESDLKFREMQLVLAKLGTLVTASSEITEDVENLGQEIANAMVTEQRARLEEKVLRGNGGGEPLGILNSGCKIAVPKEVGQAADTIVYANMTKMWARLHPAFASDAIWIANPNVLPQLLTQSITVGTGGSVVPLEDVLMRRPLFLSEFGEPLGDEGDIYLLAPSAYLFAHRTDNVVVDFSEHAKFTSDQLVWRAKWRIDGQPLYSSPWTPKKGDTMSPFITLAARA